MRLSQRSIVTIPVGNSYIQDRNQCAWATESYLGRFRQGHQYRISQRTPPSMTVRIFKPAKNAMQSGRAQTREWRLEYEPEQPRAIEPLMGWTSSGDMKQQITLHFDSKEEAVAYCERKGIPYQVIEPKQSARRQVAYADNFAFRRGEPWTH